MGRSGVYAGGILQKGKIMTGSIALFIRLGLYVAAGWLANIGWANFNETAGTVAVSIDSLAEWIAAGVAFVGAYAWSRWVKARGGKT